MPRIITCVKAYDRVLDIVDSEFNGVTFCQGNFSAMGIDVPDAIRHFGDRVNFVHFRDVDGPADNSVEAWHDAGPTDMTAAIDAYHDVGFDGPIRPDHVPMMVGEDNTTPGYHLSGQAVRGRLHARSRRTVGEGGLNRSDHSSRRSYQSVAVDTFPWRSVCLMEGPQ